MTILLFTYLLFDLKKIVDVLADYDGLGDDNKHEINEPTAEYHK